MKIKMLIALFTLMFTALVNAKSLEIKKFLSDEIAVEDQQTSEIKFVNVENWELPIPVQHDYNDGRYQFAHGGRSYIIDGIFVTIDKSYDVDRGVCKTDLKYSMKGTSRGAGNNNCRKVE